MTAYVKCKTLKFYWVDNDPAFTEEAQGGVTSKDEELHLLIGSLVMQGIQYVSGRAFSGERKTEPAFFTNHIENRILLYLMYAESHSLQSIKDISETEFGNMRYAAYCCFPHDLRYPKDEKERVLLTSLPIFRE